MKITNVDLNNAVIDESVFEVDNNTYRVRSYNPHGFYRISVDKGKLPVHLQGDYTGKLMAEQEIKRYLAEKNRPVATVVRD